MSLTCASHYCVCLAASHCVYSGAVSYEEWRSHWAARVCKHGLKACEAALMNANKWLRKVSKNVNKDLDQPSFGAASFNALMDEVVHEVVHSPRNSKRTVQTAVNKFKSKRTV